MKLGRFFWKLVLGHAALLALALAVGLWLIRTQFDRFHSEELTLHLASESAALKELAEARFGDADAAELQEIAARVGSSDPSEVQVTFIAADGTILGDSLPGAMRDSEGNEPEILQALRTGRGSSTRWSAAASRMMKYRTIRVGPPDDPLGVVRVGTAVRTLWERTLIWPIGLIAILVALGVAVGLAILWSSRIRRITRTAQSLARGDLSSRVDESGGDEVAILGRSLNRMRDRLGRQLETIDRQRRALEMVLARLNEGVLVANRDGRLVLMNPEAARLLHIPRATAEEISEGRLHTVEECVSQHDLQRLLLQHDADETESQHPESQHEEHKVDEVRLELQGESGPLTILARASDVSVSELTPKRSTGEHGRLLVLTDITDLTRAIRMRSDFVANASHELRTPLSAIRSAVETLSRLDLATEGEAAGRFVGMITRQSSRLEAMVADLLELSRLESSSKKFEPETLQVQRLCDDLQARWAEAVSAKNLQWKREIATNCHSITTNSHLLQVVLNNLIENAIKFTDSRGSVTLRCMRVDNGVFIEVEDTGCGIPEHEQTRVFERFYQVTASRSAGNGPAEQRGTGLGLSIVRHAVAALGGTVQLTSEVGRGTKIAVMIPAQAATESSQPPQAERTN